MHQLTVSQIAAPNKMARGPLGKFCWLCFTWLKTEPPWRATCIKRSFVARWHNHYYGGKVRSIILLSACLHSCLSWPAWNSHAPYFIVTCGLSGCTIFYCYLWPVWLHHIFPHYLINGTIFGGKKCLEQKIRNLIFSTIFVRNISHSKKKSAIHYSKSTYGFI